MADYFELSAQVNMGLAHRSRTNDQLDFWVYSQSNKLGFSHTANSTDAVMSFDPWDWTKANPSKFHAATESQTLYWSERVPELWEATDYAVYQNPRTYEYYRVLYYSRFKASQAQVRAAYTALTSHGQVSQFNNRVWNDIVDKTAEMQVKWGEDNNALNKIAIRGAWNLCPYITEADREWFYDPIAGYDRQNWGRTLMACKFNIVVNALEALPGGWEWSWHRDGIQTIVAGTPVKGDYILDLVRAINHFATLQKIIVGPVSVNVNHYTLTSGLELWDYFAVQQTINASANLNLIVPTELWSIIPFEPILEPTFDIPNLQIPLLDWIDPGNVIFILYDRLESSVEVWDRIALWPQDLNLESHSIVLPQSVPVLDWMATQMSLIVDEAVPTANTVMFDSYVTNMELTVCETELDEEIVFADSLNFNLVMIFDYRINPGVVVDDARVLNTVEISAEIVYNIFIEFADMYHLGGEAELGFEHTSILSFADMLNQFATEHCGMSASGTIVMSELQEIYSPNPRSMKMLSAATIEFIGKFEQYFAGKFGFTTSSNLNTADVFENFGSADMPMSAGGILDFAEMLAQYSPNNEWSLKHNSVLGFAEMLNTYSKQEYALNSTSHIDFAEYFAQYSECRLSLEHMANLLVGELVSIMSRKTFDINYKSKAALVEAVALAGNTAMDMNYSAYARVVTAQPVNSDESMEFRIRRAKARLCTSKPVTGDTELQIRLRDKVNVATAIAVAGSKLLDSRFFGEPRVATAEPVRSNRQLNGDIITDARIRVALAHRMYTRTPIAKFVPNPRIRTGDSVPVKCGIWRRRPAGIPKVLPFSYFALQPDIADTKELSRAIVQVLSGATASADIVTSRDFETDTSIVTTVSAGLEYEDCGAESTVQIETSSSALLTGFALLRADEQIATGSNVHITGDARLNATVDVTTDTSAKIIAYTYLEATQPIAVNTSVELSYQVLVDIEVSQSITTGTDAELSIYWLELEATQQISTGTSAELSYQTPVEIEVSTSIATAATATLETEAPSSWDYPIPMGDNTLYIRQAYIVSNVGERLGIT